MEMIKPVIGMLKAHSALSGEEQEENLDQALVKIININVFHSEGFRSSNLEGRSPFGISKAEMRSRKARLKKAIRHIASEKIKVRVSLFIGLIFIFI